MKQFRKRITLRTMMCGLLVSMALTSCSSVPMTGRQRVNIVSDQEILALSNQQYRQFMAKAPRSNNQAQTQRVVTIGRRIAAATEAYLRSVGLESETKKYAWEFNLVRSDQVNAFCMPGGKIVVYEGLLKYATTDDELATVMSHEVAHAMAKHANERISQQMLTQYGGNVLGVLLGGKSQAVRQVAGTAYGLGTQMLVALPYSRRHEYEADQIGLYLMALAKYNPEQALSFWRKMASGKGGQGAEFMSTHPSDANRIKAIQEELPKVRAFMGQGTSTRSALPQPFDPKALQKAEAQSKQQVVDNSNRKVPIKTHY